MSTIFELYILLRIFLVPSKYGNLLSILFSGLSVVLFIIGVAKRSVYIEKNKLLKAFAFLTLVFIIILLVSKYSIIYTSEVYAAALCTFIYFIAFDFKGVSKYLRNIAFISVVIQAIYYTLFGTVGINNESFGLISLGQKSSTSFIIFLLICIEWRRKRYLVALIYVVCTILTAIGGGAETVMNRSSLLLIAIFGLVVVYEWMKGRKNNLWIVDHPGTFFMLSAVGIILLSYGWLAITAVIGVGGYHTSIFDTSNNIRVISNIYVWQQFKSTPELIFYGYDRDIYEAMKLGVGSGYLYYMGTRIVQAHHSILDLYQRCGLVFTIAYFAYIKNFINRSCITDKNRVLLPAFAISMVMHSYLQTECLLMLAIVLFDSHYSAYEEVEAHRFALFRRRDSA